MLYKVIPLGSHILSPIMMLFLKTILEIFLWPLEREYGCKGKQVFISLELRKYKSQAAKSAVQKKIKVTFFPLTKLNFNLI